MIPGGEEMYKTFLSFIMIKTKLHHLGILSFFLSSLVTSEGLIYDYDLQIRYQARDTGEKYSCKHTKYS